MPEPLKNMFNRRFAETLSSLICDAYPPFDSQAFFARLFDDRWESRELKDRMRHISVTLHDLLPADYREALAILRQVARAMTGFGFESMIFPDFVEVYGLDDWDASLPALEQFTQQSSAEFAVRPFILKDQDRMMAQMLAWSKHEHQSVRRLASEGSRPRLPWAIALPAFKADPTPILPILEQLKQDESDFVRRSVANNLNDITKDNPRVSLDVLHRWKAIETPEMKQMIKQAARTLIKQGNLEALALLGYDNEVTVSVTNLAVEPSIVPMNGEIAFSFNVENRKDEPCSLMIDYIIYLMRANGKQTPKVFKLTQMTLAPGQQSTIKRKHSFRPVTTRKYYPGEHLLEIQINGEKVARAEFILK